jgi:hypothetical protein
MCLVLVVCLKSDAFFDRSDSIGGGLSLAKDGLEIYCASDLDKSSCLTLIEFAHETLTASDLADLDIREMGKIDNVTSMGKKAFFLTVTQGKPGC